MVIIKLTQGRETLVDDIDSDLNYIKWHYHNSGYACRTCKKAKGVNTTSLIHRVILQRKLGRRLRKGESVDHINRNKLDNRRSNLRIASHATNAVNRIINSKNTSGYKGVSWHRDKWRAYITKDDAFISLGRYDNIEDAARAYDRKARELFGEYALLNFPDD